MHCEDCGHTWTGPGYDQEIVQNSGCPNCGSYRTQVSPTHSEMEIRDMPGAAASGLDDPGGNPLQDGIWGSTDGGWQNRMKRDESFASVRKQAGVTVIPTNGQPPGFHNDAKDGVLQINQSITAKGLPPILLNGVPVPEGVNAIPTFSTDPIEVEHPKAKVVAIVQWVIETGKGYQWKETMRAGIPPANSDPVAANPDPVMAPGGTISRVAADDFDWDDDSFDPYAAAELNPYQTPQVQERFIINPRGQLLRPDERLIYAKGGNVGDIYHEDLAKAHGLPIDEHGDIPGHSLGQILSNGQIHMLTLDPSHSAEHVQQLLGQHYPEHSVDLSGFTDPLTGEQRGVSNQDRWNDELSAYTQNPMHERLLPNYEERKQQEAQDEAQRGRPYPHYDNPYFNRGGSNREAIYLPWSRETSSVDHDFEVEQVIPPGPHTKEVDYGDSTPLILQHDDPQLLTDAKEELEHHQAGLMGTIFGAGGGAIGGAMGGVPGAIAGNLLGHAVGNAISGGAHALTGGGVAAPPPQQQAMPEEYLASFHAQLAGSLDNHPSTDQGLVDRASGDPEDADPDEVNDGDHDHWQRDQDVNDQGGTDAFAPEVLSALQDAEPALEHYMHSDESGADDPSIQRLLELLDHHHPEIAEIARSGQSDPEADKILLTSYSQPGATGVPGIGGMQPSGQSPAAIAQPSVGPQQVNPTTQSACPHCGARLTAGQGICPQCNGAVTAQPNMALDQGGSPIPPAMGTTPNMMGPTMAGVNEWGPAVVGLPATATGLAVTYQRIKQRLLQQGVDEATAEQQAQAQARSAARLASQGPQTVEQIRAVNDYLTQNGRPGELENIIQNPDQYADILAQIAGRDSPPTPDPSPAAPQPMPPPGQDPSQMGMMPPASGMPMQAAADAITPPCPNCGSHTTGLISDEGQAQCSNCNHKWQTDFESQGEKTPVQTKAAVHEDLDTTWVTKDGSPLQEGAEYWMHSAKYDIPDLVRIESKKPDEIEYTLIGEYNLAHRTAVSKEEAQLDGISFESAGDAQNAPEVDNLNEQGPNDQMEAPTLAPTTYQARTAVAPAGEPHSFMGPASPEEEALQSQNWYGEEKGTTPQECPGCGRLTRPALGGCPNCGTSMGGSVFADPTSEKPTWDQWAMHNAPQTSEPKLAGKKYTPMEQREFIDEPGVARNSDKLDLEGTHYTEQASLTDDLFLFGL